MTKINDVEIPDNLERVLIDILSDYQRVDKCLPLSRNRQEMGLCDHEKKKIFLHRRLSVYERRHTLIHEVLHAYYDTVGIEADEQYVETATEIIAQRIYGADYKK